MKVGVFSGAGFAAVAVLFWSQILVEEQMSSTRTRQIERALALMERLVVLLEEGSATPSRIISREPTVPTAVQDRITYRSRYWKDADIRSALLALYGRSSSRDAESLLIAEFGRERAPGHSVIARIFERIGQEIRR